MNICANCEHCGCEPGDDPRMSVCHAPEVGFDPMINPVTGMPCYTGHLDSGEMFYADKPHPLCLWINPMGECVYFKAKRPTWFAKAMRN